MSKLRLLVPLLAIAVVVSVYATSGGPAANLRFATCAAGEQGTHGPEKPGCRSAFGRPESFLDLAESQSQWAARSSAPAAGVRPGALRHALRQARALPRAGAAWKPYGDPPLRADDPQYDTTNGSTRQGLPGISGRVNTIVRDDAGNLYAAAAGGGVWKSTNSGGSWASVGDALPIQIVGALGWSASHGGTLIALTGDQNTGGASASGLGAYYSRDGGATWKRSEGIPDDLLAFKVAVDPTNPDKVYAGTGGGLFASTDGGATFTNANLPTGDCAGKPVTVKDCYLANQVTDVVVQGAKNSATTAAQPGAVMAAVGWRAGPAPYDDGTPQSPRNGIYVSPTGAPGSFKDMDMAANASPLATDPLTQARIGRIALGVASGASQDHGIVYAIVQDAVKLNGGIAGLDASENGATSVAQSEFLNGVWVSTDFGKSWSQLEGASVIDNDTTSGSALAPPVCRAPAVVGYCPGIQAWYNLWVEPDPTRQTAAGVPTRVLFGLEEIWANNGRLTPPSGLDGSTPTKFDVIGRYYANESCTILTTPTLPVCPAAIPNGGQTPKTTTHPDQHGGLFVPDGKGGVTFFSGNDGGVFSQHTDASGAFSQGGWGQGNNNGLRTLQPYDAAMAKDGTVYMGLQDNGEAKIEPSGKTTEVFGGDAFFTAVDPDDSKVAYEEYTYGVMNVTTDGGKTWSDITPSNETSTLFSTPIQMDPANANHLITGGRQVFETTEGPKTTSDTWKQVYDLGSQGKPGDPSANAASPAVDDGPDNTLSAVDVRTVSGGVNAAYVGFCGVCDVIGGGKFANGIATNVGGDKPGKAGASDGWHIAKAAGLPNRYITSVRIDPSDPKTVYVTLGGYERQWLAPGALGDKTDNVGKGHVYKSTDAGASFTDVSGNLPDVPANWSVLRDGRLIVATNIGVFQSTNSAGGSYSRMGSGLPAVPTATLRYKPGGSDVLVAATFGRGVYTYDFRTAPTAPKPSATANASGCALSAAARRAGAKPVSGRRKLRFTIPSSNKAGTVDVFQVSTGRRIYRERLVSRYTRLSRSFTWNARANRPGRKVTDGWYFVRVSRHGRPIARITLERTRGRWSVHRDFYLRGSCGVLAFAKIERPVFGGRDRFPLRFAYRLGKAATVSVAVYRGTKRVRSFGTRADVARRTYRVTLPLKGLRKGEYRVAVTVKRAGKAVRVNLYTRLI